jgi:hypothetical protein
MRDIDHIIKRLLDEGRLRADIENGLVYSTRSNTPNKPIGTLTKKGYLRACVTVEGKAVHVMIHRVIWIAAHGVPPIGTQIDHGKAGKATNRIDNLDDVTNSENMRRAARDGLARGGWKDGPRNSATGQFVGKLRAGRLRAGREHNDFPEPRS